MWEKNFCFANLCTISAIIMIIILLPLLFLCSVNLTAFADTFKLPESKPVVSFILPDSWNPSDTGSGLSAASVDGEIYIALEFFDADSLNDVFDADKAFLDKQGVTIEDKPQHEGASTVNDMAISQSSYKGTDKDGPCEISISVVSVAPGQGLLITYWGSTDAGAKHKESLDKIFKSITKI
jgi:hypothetical protein